MKISLILAAFFGGTTVFAAPGTEFRRVRRATRPRRTLPPQNLTDATVDNAAHANGVKVQYSSNWAGATLIGSGYTSVVGTIIVPNPQKPANGNTRTEYTASAWVGIDGDTCETAILQTGVDFITQNGRASFEAWYEWYPDYSYTFDGFGISAGNTIRMTVTATSSTAGKATIENLSTGKTVSHSFSGQSASLCGTNAEWIVEDASSSSGSLIPFADFETVTFTDATAVSDGGTVDTTGAVIMDIRQNGQVLTSCSAGGSEVTCTYE